MKSAIGHGTRIDFNIKVEDITLKQIEHNRMNTSMLEEEIELLSNT